ETPKATAACWSPRKKNRKGRLITGPYDLASFAGLTVGSHKARYHPPRLPLIHPPAHRLRSRLAHSHPPSAQPPPSIWGACALARSVLVPAIVPDKKTKAAKRKCRSGFPSQLFFFLFRRLSLRIERRQVSPLRSETPSLRSGPSGDCARMLR